MNENNKETLKLVGIVAVGLDKSIGDGEDMSWKLSADLKHFKDKTMGMNCIVGRRTFDTLPKTMKGRTFTVVTRSPEKIVTSPSVTVTDDLQGNLETLSGTHMVIGGGEIYRQLYPLLDELHLTVVEGEFNSKVKLDTFDFDDWSILSSKTLPASEKDSHSSVVYHLKKLK